MMIQAPKNPETETLSLNLPSAIALSVTPEQFTALAAANRDLRLERTSQGTLMVNLPADWETGQRNCRIIGQLDSWYEENRESGKAFDSSTGFTLPKGAIRSPDASWVNRERWEALTPEQKNLPSNLS